jgi:hypothetical protein
MTADEIMLAALKEIAESRKLYCQCESMPSYDIDKGCEHPPSPHIIAKRTLAQVAA